MYERVFLPQCNSYYNVQKVLYDLTPLRNRLDKNKNNSTNGERLDLFTIKL